MLLPFPGGIRLLPHLQVPPEVLAHWPKVGDVLQRGFELQRDFLRRGRARLRARPRVRSRVPRPSQLKPGLRGLPASPLPSLPPGRSSRLSGPRRLHPTSESATGRSGGESPPLTPIAAWSTLCRCDCCFPARRKRLGTARAASVRVGGNRGVGERSHRNLPGSAFLCGRVGIHGLAGVRDSAWFSICAITKQAGCCGSKPLLDRSRPSVFFPPPSSPVVPSLLRLRGILADLA